MKRLPVRAARQVKALVDGSFVDRHKKGLAFGKRLRNRHVRRYGMAEIDLDRGCEMSPRGNRSLLAAPSECDQDLLCERFRSGIAAVRKCGVVFGQRPGQRIKADRYAPKVLKLASEGQLYREITYRLWFSENRVLDIVKRNRAT